MWRETRRSEPISLNIPDPRSLRKTDLSALVGQIINISEEQKEDLYRVLEKYIGNMTTKPGRCNLFKYKFQVELDKPIVGSSRPNPIRHTTGCQGANKPNAIRWYLRDQQFPYTKSLNRRPEEREENHDLCRRLQSKSVYYLRPRTYSITRTVAAV
jgi:hypothetical protein